MEHHIKKAQYLIIISIVLFTFMFIVSYVMISNQINQLNDRVGSINLRVKSLDQQATEHFEGIEGDLGVLQGDVGENADNLNQTALMLEQLNTEITRVGDESQTDIARIRSELNYTGTINDALESVVLIIWTDKESIVGSGFIVSEDGLIVTANHVVETFNGRTIRVKQKDGTIFSASIQQQDDDTDVALLKITVENSSYLEFSDSDLVSPGNKVFALGAPEGFGFSATEGIVSAVRNVREIKDDVGLVLDLASNVDVVQTDAAITNGNSGGPLIDINGNVVGLNSFGISKNSHGGYQDVEGLNFAISSNFVRNIL